MGSAEPLGPGGLRATRAVPIGSKRSAWPRLGLAADSHEFAQRCWPHEVRAYARHRMTRPTAPSHASSEALFRFRVISEVLTGMMRGQTRAQAVRAVASRAHAKLDGMPRTVSARTVYRWLAEYHRGELAALEPRARTRTETSAVLPEKLVTFLRTEKQADPRASVPQLLARAREHGVLAYDEPVDRTTAWRAVRRMDLPTRRRPSKHEGDMRRFAYPHRMQMVLSDGKHFRAGAARLRRVALFFLDDCTRYGLDVAVVTSESAEAFLRGLYAMLMRHGLMDALYLDRGPGFIADDTFSVLAQLHRPLIHGARRYPQGHGKIERFNQTADADVLRSLDGHPDVDPCCTALTQRLRHYLERYNDRPHESLDGASPRTRWEADSRSLRFPQDDATLRQAFIVTDERLVSRDHVIQFEGTDYEAPMGLARQKVQVHRQVLTGALSVLHEGHLVTLHPVDLAHNARARRGPRTARELPEQGPVKTAATLAFERDFAPVVDGEGGFCDKE